MDRCSSESGDGHRFDSGHLEDLKVQLSLKDVEVGKLLNELQSLRLEKEAEVEATRRSLEDARSEKLDLERKVQSLTLKLEGQADYATIKKDLAILKVISNSSFTSNASYCPALPVWAEASSDANQGEYKYKVGRCTLPKFHFYFALAMLLQ